MKRWLALPLDFLVDCWFAFLSGLMLLAFWLDEWWAGDKEEGE